MNRPVVLCSIDGCGGRMHARTWCGKHYSNWYYRGGVLNDALPRTGRVRRGGVPIGQRFWSKVDFSNPDGCWLWTGARRHTYGQVFVNNERHYAHRIAYALVHGGMPDDWVLHRCDTPLCVRPDHLYEGTQTDNMADVSERGRWRNQYASGRVAA